MNALGLRLWVYLAFGWRGVSLVLHTRVFIILFRGLPPYWLKGEWQCLGHNPLGALSVFAMLGLLGFQAVTGLFATDAIAFNGPLYRAVPSSWNDTITSWHKLTEWYIYGLIGLHISTVLFYTLVK